MGRERVLSDDHARLMDRVYRSQRHFYDVTRRYYLLGRNRLIDELAPPVDGNVLEVGCGTGRNLVQASRKYPSALFHGLDISSAMLETAAEAAMRSGMAQKIKLVCGDASHLDGVPLLQGILFERIYMSYTLSMIPDWKGALHEAMAHLTPGGSLHIIDFGTQEKLPRAFRYLLRKWLIAFHVTPRDEMQEMLECGAKEKGAELLFQPLYRGYASYAVLRMQTGEERDRDQEKA